MKNLIRLLSVSILFMVVATTLPGQNNPFAVKTKSASATGFMPKKVQPVPGYTASQASRYSQTAVFKPVSHPMPVFSTEKGIFTNKRYNQHGQLIFLSGELPGAIRLDLKSAENLEAACFEYLEAIQADLRMKDARNEFIIRSQQYDELGISHVKLQQVYQGIPIFGGEIYLHSSGNQIGLYNGNAYPTPTLNNVTPSVDAFQAQLTVIMDVSKHAIYRELNENQKTLLNYNGPIHELVVYHKDRDPRQQFLAWHVTIRPNFIERWEYFIDAKTGFIIHFYNNTHYDGDVTATGTDLNGVNRTVHAYLEAGTYYMVDVSRSMFNPQNMEGTMRVYDANYTSPSLPGFNPGVASSSNNTWGPKVISSQYNAGLTYEYFRTTHSKNSWNNKGGSILSIVNATEDNGSGMDNAYWNGVCVVYGNGATYFKPLAGALDVSAHELGHAFDEGSANLEYQNESGALNEAFSDIAGAVVERQNWKIGEDIVKTSYFPTGCLRDMSNPHNGGTSLGDPGYQPAHVNEMYIGTNDNGGVHINSGIINNVFYRYVTAVGMEKGEKTFFRTLFNYLTRSSQFIDCRLAVIQSAKDLYGDGSAEVNAAKAAFDAVGIVDGSGGNYQNQLPVNPGQDYILSYDMATADPTTLYVSSTAGSNYIPISETQLVNKPSIVDNGSLALFIGADKKMHAITLGGTYEENIIQDEPIWSNVAISKDGTKIAAVTESVDSAIYIYSYQKEEWVKAHLYNPTTQVGVVTNNVLYADALEWDYTGEYIMYDAYNQMNSSTSGQNVDYWDISFMQVWDNASSDWGTGDVFKLVSGLSEGISIGNASLSKNSPTICAFDYLDANTNYVSVLASNLETGDFIEVFNNGTTLGYPNYSKLDDQIIFSALYQGSPVIATIAMQPDKIHPASATANVLIPDAKWGVWFTQGNRPLAVDEIKPQTGIRIYPNPASEMINIVFDQKQTGPITIEIFDIRGVRIYTNDFTSSDAITIDGADWNPGLYLLKAVGADFSLIRKIVMQ